MAVNTAISTTFDRVWTTTRPEVIPKVWDNVSTDIPFIHYLYEKGLVDFVTGGAALDFMVLKELGQAIGYAPGATTLSPVTLDPATRGRYNWKNLALTFKIPGPEIAQNQGPNQVANLIAIIVESVRISMVQALGGTSVGIHSSADETNLGAITGLGNLVKIDSTNNALGTTGTRSRVTNSDWRNTIGTAITAFGTHGVARMRSALFTAQRGNESVDLILLNATAMQNLLAALTGTYTFNTPLEMRVASTGRLDVGVPGLNFHGALVMKDANIAANEIRGINTKYLRLRVHKDRNLTFSDWVSMLPVGEDAIAAGCLWMGNLGLTNLAQSFGITGGDTN